MHGSGTSDFKSSPHHHCLLSDSINNNDSSLLSSTCGEKTILQSLKKIEQLKEMYHQTITERNQIIKQRTQLLQFQDSTQNQMKALIRKSISQTFGSFKNSSAVSRAGSITKQKSLKKGTRDKIQIETEIENHINEEKVFNLKGFQKNKISHKKIASNLVFTGQEKHIKSQKQFNRQAGRKSLDFEELKIEVRKIWEQNPKQTIQKKSYLSPRSTFLRSSQINSPRNSFFKD